MIPVHIITRIREAVDLRHLAAAYVRLTRQGVRAIGLCPFHREKTGSFAVWTDHFYCFGCGKKGSAVDFVMALEGMSFRNAVKYLASQYGVQIEDTPVTRQQYEQASQQARMCEWWWYQKFEYLQERLSQAVEEQDDDFAQSLGNILIHMRARTPAERFAIFTRQITHKEREEYTEFLRYEQAFEQSWLGLAKATWAH